jgi:hypothetical protein
MLTCRKRERQHTEKVKTTACDLSVFRSRVTISLFLDGKQHALAIGVNARQCTVTVDFHSVFLFEQTKPTRRSRSTASEVCASRRVKN